MQRGVWSNDELKAILSGLATTAMALDPPTRAGYGLALATVAQVLGLPIEAPRTSPPISERRRGE